MKRLIACCLMLVFLLGLGVPVLAAGEEPSVKEIHTVEQLQAIAQDPGGSYVLMKDLDMSGISWKGLDFTGSFDGNGHMIANLRPETPGDNKATSYDGNIKGYDTAFYGLFATLTDATVKNLQLLNVRAVVESDEPVFLAGLAGYCINSTISDCTVTGCLELRAHDRMFGVAGMVGYGSGTVERCTVDVTLICTDMDRATRDEQFMAAVFATGFMDVFDCTVHIDGYSSEYGYAHNGGITGMYMQNPLGLDKQGKLTGNTVTGKITFFEWNSDRRAYCAAEAGEVLAFNKLISGNTCDFIRDERKEFDVELRPEQCEAPSYGQVVTEPGCDSFGYTVYTCSGCGYSYSDHYTLPQHKVTNWVVTQEPTVEQEGMSIANCDDCGMAFSRTEEKLPPPPETEPMETTEAAAPTENSGSYDRAQEQRTLLILAVLAVASVCAAVVLIVIGRKGKK